MGGSVALQLSINLIRCSGKGSAGRSPDRAKVQCALPQSKRRSRAQADKGTCEETLTVDVWALPHCVADLLCAYVRRLLHTFVIHGRCRTDSVS